MIERENEVKDNEMKYEDKVDKLKGLDKKKIIILKYMKSQLSVNGMGLTKPLTTSLNHTSKHSNHLREPSKGGR